MASDTRGRAARLSELVADTRALALVGLAKNTGKTETLAAILREHAASDTPVGVTSIGRDGEEHDVIDARIDKPRVQLQRGSLVATTGALLRSSGLAHERLAQTGVRTPLGEVVLARAVRAGHRGSRRPERGDGPARGERADARAGRRAGADRRRDRPPRGLLAGRGGRARDGDGGDSQRRRRSGGQRHARRCRPGATSPRGRRESRRADLARPPPGAERRAGGDRGAPARARRGERVRDRGRARASASSRVCWRRAASAPGASFEIVAGDPTKVFLSRRGPRWYARQGVAITVLTDDRAARRSRSTPWRRSRIVSTRASCEG